MPKIKGTLVYHLPFHRNDYMPPQVTLIIKKKKRAVANKDTDIVYSVGLSVCSRNDQFSKKIGLIKANGKLSSRDAIHSFTVDDLIKQIKNRLAIINGEFGNIRADVFSDLNLLKDKWESMRVE